MTQIKYDTAEELANLQRRAMVLKPKLPSVIATSLGWEQPRPNGTLELIVSFKGLDELLGIETANEDDPVLELNLLSNTAIDEDDTDLPPVNTLAASILSAPVVVEDNTITEKPSIDDFLARIKDDVKEDGEDKPKKKGGRPKKETAE